MPRKTSLPSDFCIVGSTPDARLSHLERLTLLGGKELSRALGWIARGLSSLSIEFPLHSVVPSALTSAASFYASPAWASDPASFFEIPAAAPQTTETVVHGLQDGEIVDVTFRNGFIPRHPAFLARFLEDEVSQKCTMRVWRHHGASRPTIIAIHGWNMADHRMHALTLFPGFLYREGFNVVLYELPYHGRRMASSGTPGHVFPNADAIQTNEAIALVIWELRLVRRLMLAGGASEVGVLGMSLGGYCAALWAGLDQLSFCIPIVPLVSMADIAWKLFSGDARLGSQLSRSVLKKLFYVHSPLSHPCRVPKDRLLLIAGRGDKVIPRLQVARLHRHWGRPRLVWVKGGHAAHVDGTKAFDEVVDFLHGIMRKTLP